MSGILEEIQQNYVVSISSRTIVHENSYEDGEGKYVNDWCDGSKNYQTKNLNDIKGFLIEYFEKESGYDLYMTIEDIDELILYMDGGTEMHRDFLTDSENIRASQTEIEKWQSGQDRSRFCYNSLLMVSVEINGILLDGDNLISLGELA